MSIKLIHVLFLMLYSASCFPASMGFNAPSKIFLPGELFTNSIVINYHSYDSIATGLFLNVQWESDTVEVRTALWNEVDFSFDSRKIYNSFSNQYSNIFLYSSCRPKLSSWNNNTNLTIVKLICVIVGRELCDIEFNDYTNAVPFPTAAVNGHGKDILGDPDVSYDGFDVLPIITRSTAGYVMAADLSADNVAIVRDKTNIVVNLIIKAFGNPLAYEHIRATIDYNEDVTECNTNIFDVQPWLENVKFTVEKTNVIRTTSLGVTTNLEPVGVLTFEAECPLTNFTGKLAEFHFKPIDYDESEFEFDEMETFVKRNKVNLLGLVDEDDDGLENSIVYVLPAGKMRYILKTEGNIGEKHSNSKATLYLTSEKDEYFDDLNCSLFFNTNLIRFSNNENLAFKLNPDFSNVAVSTFGTGSINETNRLYNQKLCVDITFDDIITNKKDELIEIGEIIWTNLEYGVADFFFDVEDSYIEFEGRDLIDDEKQYSEFPVSMQIIEFYEPSTNIFLVKLIPAGLTNHVLEPGQKIEIDICGINNYPIYGSGEILWRYDSTSFKVTDFSPNMWTNSLVIENGSITSDVFGIDVNFSSPGAVTTFFGDVTFQALNGEKLYLEPLRKLSIVTNFWWENILGSMFSTNDGVFGMTLVSKEPEEIFMRLKPTEDLFAGNFSEFALELLNPLTSSWTSLRAEFEIDEDELLITNKSLNIKISDKFPSITVEKNIISKSTNIYQKTIITPSNSFTRVLTSLTSTVILQLSSDTPVNINKSEILGSFYGQPLEEEILYDFYINSQTGFFDLTYVKSYDKNTLNENLLSDDSILSETEWLVSPSGVKIWIKSNTDSRPRLQTSRNMSVYVDNPSNIKYDHVTLAWSYDADNFEVLSAEVLGNFTGKIWIENHDDGDGYLCADLISPYFITNSEVEVLKFDILPKLTDILEMDLDEINVTPTNEIIPGVWQGNYNLLETLDDDVYDNYQEWRRGTELTQAPLLYIEDIDDLSAGETILNLKDAGSGLEVYKENVNYKWWVKDNKNTEVIFDFKSMIGRMFVKENWTGEEIFWIYCQNLNNGLISKDSIKIDAHNSNYDWDKFAVIVDRDDYFTITDVDFNDLSFSIINPPENYSLNAFIIENGYTNPVPVIENNGEGNIEWHSPNFGGIYYGTIVATNLDDPKDVAFKNFSITVLDSYSNTDIDGDRFEVKHNKSFLTLDDPTRIHIVGGSNKDKLKIKVWRNKDTGDGIVNFDEIVSDSGIKSLFLDGGVNLIQTEGPIGSIKVKKGVVGQIIAKNGGVRSVKISTAWNNYDEEFYEVGLRKGISAQGNIGVVKVTGGDIGTDYEPAVISSAEGNIKAVITKMQKKVYWDGPNFWDDIYVEIAGDEGANIYANIYALKGNIGSVIAIGGKIGTLLDDIVTEIYSGNNIKKIIAVAQNGDAEILGGFIHSDIIADGNINKIMAQGGDICNSDSASDIDGSFDETELIEYPVIIYANEIKKISANGRVYGFRDGPTIDDAWREVHGGNISSYIVLQKSIGKIISRAGNVSIYLETKGDIKNIKVNAVPFKEYWDDDMKIVGGSLLYSVILPNVQYRSTNPADYKNKLNKLNAGLIKESWIGIKGPYNPKKFKYRKILNFELWAGGQKVN